VEERDHHRRREFHVIILAAGQSTRIGLPGMSKVLLTVGRETIIEKVVKTAESLGPDSIQVVVGFMAEKVMQTLGGRRANFVFQLEQLGTGHAVQQTEKLLRERQGDALILLGDVPLITAKTLKSLIEEHRGRKAAATVLSAIFENPSGYGRILRDKNGALEGILEDRDARDADRLNHECNSGIFCFEVASLFAALEQTRRDNAQKQYYLTDTIRILREMGKTVHCVTAESPEEVLGINNQQDLLHVRRAFSLCAESSDTSANNR
jgi:bifunctional UDP-N-acetylglucosamine pyrophosphorylase/glucosamine-1-phosphate N-acetyltransferase